MIKPLTIKPLLTATALVAALSTAAIAQDVQRPGTGSGAAMDSQSSTMNADDGTMKRPGTGTESHTTTMNAGDSQYGVTVFSKDRPRTPMTTQNGYITGSQGQVLASNLIGEEVYNGTGDRAEKVGDVNDVMMSSDGKAEAVVIGVGGFLGVGEKDVAVAFDRLNWSIGQDNEKRLTIQASKDDLKSAPTFKR